eukprot:TRINITY_DN91106_c0_g1_i1.p1 TRINITY_DN91106_c0_g1~~TRINITY_DN91106_c0_g1_i1.p1  ORF type:complete len:662 (-),score=155.84 TRINITY_DN91106_c0_g1_i1:154-2139(-)
MPMSSGNLRRYRSARSAAGLPAVVLSLFACGCLYALAPPLYVFLSAAAGRRCGLGGADASQKLRRPRGVFLRQATIPDQVVAAAVDEKPADVQGDVLSGSGGSFGLRISDPASLLNNMAERYEDVSRIMMEFVDNSFDSAESLFDMEQNAYTRPILIDIVVAGTAEEPVLWITDNCEGMAPETLCEVVTKVGESKKRGQSFVNGQFGFGFHSFRACAENLRASSRSAERSPPVEVVVNRHQSEGFQLREVEPEHFQDFPATGTRISLENFEHQWVGGNALSIAALRREIETHFERLLSRGNLKVSIRNAGKPDEEEICKPLDYRQINGSNVTVDETIDLGHGQYAEVLLAVVPRKEAKELERPVRFFGKGRRIQKVLDVKSFANGTGYRWDVWGHHQLVGYIDIKGSDNGPLRPVITRDDFVRTKDRKKAYKAIADKTEMAALEALEAANNARSQKTMQELEKALTDSLQHMDKKLNKLTTKQRKESFAEEDNKKEDKKDDEDKKEDKKDEEKEKDNKPEPEDKEKKEKREKSDPRESAPLWKYTVKLVDGFKDEDDPTMTRSSLDGNVIFINTLHEDFQSRYRKTRSGMAKVDLRLISYMANIVSSHYREILSRQTFNQEKETQERLHELMIETYCQYEDTLVACMPALNNRIEQLTKEQ